MHTPLEKDGQHSLGNRNGTMGTQIITYHIRCWVLIAEYLHANSQYEPSGRLHSDLPGNN